MQRFIWLGAIAIVLFVAGTGFGFLLNNALLAGDGEASEAITAPTLDPAITATPSVPQLSAEVADLQTENDGLQAQVDALSTQVAEGMSMPEVEMTEAVEVEDEPEAEITESESASLGRVLYRIITEESEVRFSIDEVLNGAPFTAIGRTSDVAADVIIDFDNPASSQLGTVRVNVRTLATDSSMRNNAIRGRILESAQDEYEFAEFVPTSIVGLPDSVAVGDSVSFTIEGDFTLHGVTQTISFEATVTIVAEDRIEGSATTTVLYEDYNLTIPSVRSVSDVTDEVILEIDFVALLVEE